MLILAAVVLWSLELLLEQLLAWLHGYNTDLFHRLTLPPSGGPLSSEGYVAEMPEKDLQQCAAALRSYLLYDVVGKSPYLSILLLLECWLPCFALRLLGAEEVRLQIVVEAGVSQRLSRYEESGFSLLTPVVPLPVVIDYRIRGAVQVSSMRVVIPDALMHHFFDSIRGQLAEVDIRGLDPRFRDFTEPVHVNAELALEWRQKTELSFVLRNVRSTFHLPM